MEKRFTDKVVVVTGGCRGIGKSVAMRFAGEGAKVYALDYVIPETGEDFSDSSDINSLVKMFQADVSNEESVKNAIDSVIKDAGRIDVLVNNAGITRDALVMRMSEKQWDDVLNTNLKGAFLCAKTVSRQMTSQRAGRIINMGSIIGSIGNAGQANYAASKAGLIGLTKSLAKEFASRNILVNLVAPGYVITEMTKELDSTVREEYEKNIPLKRGALPEDIANVVAFFASEDSSYITGQIIHVDGGLAI
jgi:3-oxoacyl-[acyl-carrier protein] reductase